MYCGDATWYDHLWWYFGVVNTHWQVHTMGMDKFNDGPLSLIFLFFFSFFCLFLCGFLLYIFVLYSFFCPSPSTSTASVPKFSCVLICIISSNGVISALSIFPAWSVQSIFHSFQTIWHLPFLNLDVVDWIVTKPNLANRRSYFCGLYHRHIRWTYGSKST